MRLLVGERWSCAALQACANRFSQQMWLGHERKRNIGHHCDQPGTMVEISIRKHPRSEAVANQRKFFKKTARGKVIKGQTIRSGCSFGFVMHYAYFSPQRKVPA